MDSLAKGSIWSHTNGNEYTVLLMANEYSENQDKYPTTVVYQGKNKRIWSRPLSDWHRSMKLEIGSYDE